jgi:hypothetical protein
MKRQSFHAKINGAKSQKTVIFKIKRHYRIHERLPVNPILLAPFSLHFSISLGYFIHFINLCAPC